MDSPKKKSMRNHWFDHVRKTRKKLSKGLPELVSHREAMKKASISWGELKIKISRKIAREEKRAEKLRKKQARSTELLGN
jgi:hypothetical protein